MGCTTNSEGVRPTYDEGVRPTQDIACNLTLPALPTQHQKKPQEQPLPCKQDSASSTFADASSIFSDSINKSSFDSTTKLRNTSKGLARIARFSSASEESDVLTDELSADPYETSDTQTDADPKEEEEIFTQTQMRDEKFMTDRAATREKQKAEKEE
eukprot:CAMPEP_0198215758 /NCGR_PEP_ID=MMETSP1445-20131203/52451_1 /TAXON_ID=36898 /ORGANISM="Pyramimonas sp., Strain CCMP2087" /LENGTH=156 /DNA_ID=CAMNT_0043891637 /DNA_START=53 /DNA_END=520 /DNA_ORIENTATION=-